MDNFLNRIARAQQLRKKLTNGTASKKPSAQQKRQSLDLKDCTQKRRKS
jgi:hypothetical protein